MKCFQIHLEKFFWKKCKMLRKMLRIQMRRMRNQRPYKSNSAKRFTADRHIAKSAIRKRKKNKTLDYRVDREKKTKTWEERKERGKPSLERCSLWKVIERYNEQTPRNLANGLLPRRCRARRPWYSLRLSFSLSIFSKLRHWCHRFFVSLNLPSRLNIEMSRDLARISLDCVLPRGKKLHIIC